MITTRFIRPVLALAAFAAFGMGAQPALAGSPEGAPTAMIKLDRSSLVSARSEAKIQARIVAAARKVCPAGGNSLQEQMNARECFKKAVRTSNAQLLALRQTARGSQPVLAAANSRPTR